VFISYRPSASRRKVARRELLEDPLSEFANQPNVGGRVEGKQPNKRIDGHVIVEQSKPGQAFQGHADGRLSNGRRAKDDDERH
jgi:hypothetical protein